MDTKIGNTFLHEEEFDQFICWFYRNHRTCFHRFLRKHKRLLVMNDETLYHLSSRQEEEYENVDCKTTLATLPQMYWEIII